MAVISSIAAVPAMAVMTLHARDVALLVAVSAASSVVVTGLGLALLKWARRRPLRDAALIVALTPVLTVVIASAAATMSMFLSTTAVRRADRDCRVRRHRRHRHLDGAGPHVDAR